MLKTQIVDSRNIRKTVAFKSIQIILALILIFLIVRSLNLFGDNSAITNFTHDFYSSNLRPFAIFIIILAVGLSILMKSRLKNPKILGTIELDSEGYQIFLDNSDKYVGNWVDVQKVLFEFYSSASLNNPKGCMNYLTIEDQNGRKSYEICIENSLMKADFGEFLREINNKIAVKVNYTILLKKIFRDNDFKF